MSKRVLITGGTKGIGYYTTKLFVNAGYDVVVVARNFSEYDIEGTTNIVYDLQNISNINDLVSRVGDIDILINNAGIDRNCTYDNYPEEEIEKIVNVNLKTPVELMSRFSEALIRNKGRVVNVASQAAQIGHRDIWYGITKAGLVNATISFAALLGDKGVVINAVAPGPVATGFMATSIYRDRFEHLKDRTISGRYATPSEVAEIIYWLATSAPEYLNGETIDINNGAQRIKARTY